MATETLYLASNKGGVSGFTACANPDNALGSGTTTWAGPALNANTSFGHEWYLTNPADSHFSGASQTLVVRARKGSNTGNPTITASMYSAGGSLLGSSATTSITSTTGQDVTFTFTPASTVSAQGCYVRVVMTGVGGSGSARNAAQISRAVWSADTATPSGPTDHVGSGSIAAVSEVSGAPTPPPAPYTYAETSWTTGGTASGTTGEYKDVTVTAQAGDLIVAVGLVESFNIDPGTRSITTVSGSTSAWTLGQPNVTFYSDLDVIGGWATASSSGSITVRVQVRAGATAWMGVAVWVIPAASWSGTPAWSTFVADTDGLASVTLAGTSTVLYAGGDWTAQVPGTPIPSGGTVHEAYGDNARYGVSVISWTDQAAGTRSYGPTASGGDWSGVILAVPAGTGGGPTAYPASGSIPSTSGVSGSVTAQHPVTGSVAAVSASTGTVTARRPASGTITAVTSTSGAAERTLAEHPASGSIAATTTTSGDATLNVAYPGSGTIPAVSEVVGAVEIPAPPSWPGVVQYASGTASGTKTFTASLPAASQTGNAVLVFIYSTSSYATPSGFTMRHNRVNWVAQHVFERAGDGSSSWEFTANSATGSTAWTAIEVRGGVYDTAASAESGADATSYATPTIAPASGTVTFAAIGSQATQGSPETPRTMTAWSNDFLEIGDECVAVTTRPMQGVAVKAGGTSTTGTYSSASRNKSAIIISYTATLSVDHAGAGSVPAVSGTAGSVSARLPASGVILVVAAASGSVTAQHPVTGSVPAVSAANGSVTSRRPASGVVAAVSTASGSVTAQHPVSGQITAITSTSGAITRNALALPAVGRADAITAVTGSVTAQHPVVGSIPAISAISGSVAARRVAAGLVAAVTAASGTVTATHVVSGSAEAVSTAAGSAVRAAPASGAVPATSTAAGTIIVRLSASGQVIAITAASGTLAPQAVSGSAAATSTVTGSVTAQHAVFGGIPAASTVTGQVRGDSPASGQVITTTTITGTVTARHQVTGQIAATSTATGTLYEPVQHPATGTVTVVTDTSGSMLGAAAATGFVHAVSGVAGSPTAVHPIQGTIPASTTTSGSATTRTPATGTLAATSGTFGSLTANLAVSGAITATSGASGTVQSAHAVTGTVAIVSAVLAGTISEGGTGGIPGQSGVTGSVTASLNVRGTVDSTSTSAGSISLRLNAAGSTAAVSTTSGAVVQPGASGVVSGISGTSGAIGLRQPVSGSLTITSSAYGEISARLRGSGIVGSTSSISGEITVSTSASGQVGGDSGGTGTVTADHVLVGTVEVISGVVGAVVSPVPEITPDERTLRIPAEHRTFTVSGEPRILRVPPAPAPFAVTVSTTTRVYKIAAESRTWRHPMATPPVFKHDPEARLDYAWDWTNWLQADESIVSADITTTGSIAAETPTIGAGIVTAWITAGTEKEYARATLHITTSAGREDDRSLTLYVIDR